MMAPWKVSALPPGVGVYFPPNSPLSPVKVRVGAPAVPRGMSTAFFGPSVPLMVAVVMLPPVSFNWNPIGAVRAMRALLSPR